MLISPQMQAAIRRRWLRVPEEIRNNVGWQSKSEGHFLTKDHHPVHLLNADRTMTLCNRPKGKMYEVVATYEYDPVADCIKCRDKALKATTGTALVP